MPKMFLHYPQGAFTRANLELLAQELTQIGLQCERMPETTYGRSNVWLYAREYPIDQVFVGGRTGGTKVITIEVNAFEGGLDDTAKEALIEGFTDSICKLSGTPSDARCPVFVLIRKNPASDWGIFGKRVTLAKLRHPPVDADPV